MFSLQGHYRIDRYNPQNELVDSAGVGNFITSTGLSYPLVMPFASTFKYLSLGTGTGVNTVLTTGLYLPHHTFTSLSEYVAGGCGSVETPTGLQLHRSWLVSGIYGNEYQAGLTINELGVSPLPISGDNSGASLFSRVRMEPEFLVPSGDYSIITYRLDIGLPTGVQSFKNIINTTQVNTTDSPVCRYWNTLSGLYSVVHNGMMKIDEDGLNIEPNMEASLEPSDLSSNHTAYLSTDNVSFTLNPVSGGAVGTGSFKPWNPVGRALSRGVCQYNSSVDDDTLARLTSIRRGSVNIPVSGDFRTETSETVYSRDNSILTISADAFTYTGRTRAVTRLFSWPNTQNQFQDSFGNDRRIRALVLAYGDSYLPYCDMQFASSGLQQNYNRNTNNYTYTGNITGDYVFIDPYDNLSLSFKLGWSSPCPSTVSGCPGY